MPHGRRKQGFVSEKVVFGATDFQLGTDPVGADGERRLAASQLIINQPKTKIKNFPVFFARPGYFFVNKSFIILERALDSWKTFTANPILLP